MLFDAISLLNWAGKYNMELGKHILFHSHILLQFVLI